jgi:di/tricarboxylate transporter
MTLDLAVIAILLVGVVVVLATGALRADLTALAIIVLVAVFGLVPPDRAIAGFSNPAVLAVAGMYILSAALSRTGVADWVGDGLIRWSGTRELPLMLAVAGVSGVLSGFINNIGVAAMMLPVTMRLARKAEVSPSRLLIPMVMGAQLGGFTTLIGTSANLLGAEVLAEAGFEPFSLLSFTPLGGALLLVGLVFLALVAPRVLPRHELAREGPIRRGIRDTARIEDRLFFLEVPGGSSLHGHTLRESLVGPALGLHVLAIFREGAEPPRTGLLGQGSGADAPDTSSWRLAPGPDARLEAGDRLLVQGRPDFFRAFQGRRHLAAADSPEVPVHWLNAEDRVLVAVSVREDDPLVGRNLHQADLRRQTGALALALRREGFQRRTHVQEAMIQGGDRLLLQLPAETLHRLYDADRFERVEILDPATAVERFELGDRLWAMKVTEDSILRSRKISETRLGDAMGVMVLAVGRGDTVLLPDADTVLDEGDHLLVKSRPEDLVTLRALQRLRIVEEEVPDSRLLESDEVGFVDAVLAPRSSLIGKTLREVGFRRRYGMHVVAVVREGGRVRSELRDQALAFGDALLLYGPRSRARRLAQDPDLILLEDPGAPPPDRRRAPRSLLVMALALGPVIAGLIPVAVGVLTGVLLMILTRCLSVEEAYRAVEWPVVVLVAGMLALGAALDSTGAAVLVGEGLLGGLGNAGPMGMLAALVLLSTVSAQIMPGPAVVVLLGPMAVAAALSMGVEPHAFVLGVTVASTSLASPVAQPSLALVMAPGGYRVGDYLPLGLPMTALVLLMTVLLAPILFPF